MPTAANGYAFMGFYDEEGGSGTKYYNADGSSAHNWDKNTTEGTTLYAYYKKAEITAITFDAAVVESEGTVSFAVTISPEPTGTTKTCFTVLYSNDNPLASQPTITYDGGTGKYSFTAPEASGTYKVEAVLRTGSSCDGGTELDTDVANFQVEGTHTVTVRYKCGDEVIKASTTLEGIEPLEWSDAIEPAEIFGYTFNSWTAGDGVTISTNGSSAIGSNTTTTSTIYIKATYDGYLTANYTQNSYIYFKNTLGWSSVYVNFYTGSYWNNPKGSGNKGVTNSNKAMTRIGETDVWYYDYGAASITPSLYVSFTDASQDNSENFWKNPNVNVVYPANYQDAIHTDKSSENGFKAATPMFVPLANQEATILNSSGGGKASYYNRGYWTTYTSGTGYTLEIYNSAGNSLLKSIAFTSEDDLMPMKATVDLEAATIYKFQLRRGGTDSYGIYYGNSGTMTYAEHGAATAWDMTNSSFSMCGITTNAAGDYTFNLSYSGNSSNPPHYRLRIAVDYPIASGDYRLVYTDNKPTAKPSAIVPKVNNGKDTVSFFIRPGNSPELKIQTATVNPSTGAITWGSDAIVTSSISSLTKDSVYNICLTMNESGAISVENVEAYTGNFYIRTDAANSKWDNYRSDPDHLMTYSEYSITHGGFSHYYTHWVEASSSRKNVKFCIANDYSPCISDTLTRETASGTWANIGSHIDASGNLTTDANIRFMWNRHDNAISRAYVDGAQGVGSNNFLYILSSDGKIKNSDNTALTDNKVQFSDNGNWVYEANLKVQPTAQIKLLSNWGTSNIITQYFKGSSSETEELMGGSGTEWYNIRILYDYKTNRMVSAYMPSGTISADLAVHADVMFVREHQGDIAEITFENNAKITDIENIYSVLQFNKWTLNNKSKADGHAALSPLLSRYERDLFYVSFPFDVKVSDIIGFGTYGTHWIIEYYDGAGRAEKGFWADSESFWKFVTPSMKNTFTLKAGTGYIVALDLDELGESASVWDNTDNVELLFPGNVSSISSTSVTYEMPAHTCTIGPRFEGGEDRRVKDSHWNVLGVPTYHNLTTANVSAANTTWIADHPNYIYTWNMADNSLSATSASGFNYHAMHAYIVQYSGNVTFTTSTSPAPAAPARNTEAQKEIEFRMELLQDASSIDHTFVKLSDDEQVSSDFAFGEDLSKEFNNGKANIYTFIADVQAAGNTLPMSEQTTIVPVGVKITSNDDYTFSIPEGTSGVGVTLIDKQAGTRTNLSALDYTVSLEAGTYDDRFVLEISPIQQVVTDVKTSDIRDQKSDVRKQLIDGLLYIIRDGKMYDAHGACVE